MRTVFLVCLLIACYAGRGQLISISSDKNKVLYAGVENPLTIVVSNVALKNVIVKTDNGTLKGEDGHYVFYTDTGSAVNITIFNKNSNKQIGIETFYVRQIPDPSPHVGSYSGGAIPLSYIRAQAGVRTGHASIYYQKGIPVTSFTVSIIRNNDYVFKEIKNEGDVFNEEVQKAFQQLRVGDSVVINNIFARRSDGTLTILNTLTFTIK